MVGWLQVSCGGRMMMLLLLLLLVVSVEICRHDD
jgi:hypothetical protein